jgi:hypothetical protein
MKNLFLVIVLFCCFSAEAQNVILKADTNSVWVDKDQIPLNKLRVQWRDSSMAIIGVENNNIYSGAKPYYRYTNAFTGTPFGSLDSLKTWIRENFFVDASGGGAVGGDTATLTSVTTGAGNNITPNAIQSIGYNNLNMNKTSTVLLEQGTNGGIYRIDSTLGGVAGAIEISNSVIALSAAGTASLNVQAETPSVASVSTSGRLQTHAGINASDAVIMSQLLTLGETSTTAYRGDRGKAAYDHSQLTSGTNPHNTTFANIASKPTTLSGFGITDAYPLSGNPSGFLTSVPAQSFASLTGKPTTVAGYGITDAIIQGGQSLGVSMSIGTNDNQTLTFRANGATRVSVTGAGNLITTGSIYSTNNIITNTNSITPTHSITIPSVGTGIAQYNTVNQTTDYDRVRLFWSSNVYNITSEALGTGTVRNISINGSIFNSSGITATALIKSGGTSAQFLKADGSVDASKTLSGTAVLTGDAIATTFTVTHGFGSTGYEASISPTNLLSGTSVGAGYFITNKTSTTFDVSFVSAPAIGALNIDWNIHKN